MLNRPGTPNATMMGMRCIDFHKPEWTHRKLTRYYYKMTDGQIRYLWAYDATDGLDSLDSIDNPVMEYGNV